MKILFITPSLPNRLHRIRSFNLIKYLSLAGNKIHLVSLWKKNQLIERDFEELKKYCFSIDLVYLPLWQSFLNCLIFLFSFLPLEVAYCRSKKMEKAVKEAIEKYQPDLIYLKRLRSAQFILSIDKQVNSYPLAKLLKSGKLILDSTDAMSLFYKEAFKKTKNIFEKILFFEETLKYRLYEKYLFKKFKKWALCSQKDIDYLKNSAPNNIEFLLVENGVDLDEFRISETQNFEKNTLLFSGLMDKFVNIDGFLFFIQNIWPILKKEIPDLKIYIAGPNPSSSILKYHNNKDIIVAGFVKNLKEYIFKAEVVICPIRVGTGTRNKILQAMALSRPVVSSSKGAEGLLVENGKNIFISDDSQKFAQNILTLLKNKKKWQNMSQEGRKLVEEKYSMEKIARKINL